MVRWAGLAVAAALLAAGPAWADDLDDAVPGHASLTYGALVRQAMPKLAKGDGGAWDSGPITGLRSLDGKPDTDTFGFSGVTLTNVVADGRPMLLLLTDDTSGDNGFGAVLMAFDDGPAGPKLIDAMDVGQDRFTSIDKVLHLTRKTDAFLVVNSHDNSNQTYVLTTSIYLRGGRLKTAMTTLFSYGEQGCGYRYGQETAYSVKPAPGARYGSIVIKVTETQAAGDDCGDDHPHYKAFKRAVSDTYRWNEAKGDFVAITGAVDRLSDKTFKRATQ